MKDIDLYERKDQKIIELEYNIAIKKATVAYVGTDCLHTKVGDTVIINTPIGLPMDFEGTKYLIIREGDVMFWIQ